MVKGKPLYVGLAEKREVRAERLRSLDEGLVLTGVFVVSCEDWRGLEASRMCFLTQSNRLGVAVLIAAPVNLVKDSAILPVEWARAWARRVARA